MSVRRLVKRLNMAGRFTRPKIAGMSDVELAAFIEKTLPEREKFYNRANFVLDCGDASNDTLLRLLLQHIDNSSVK